MAFKVLIIQALKIFYLKILNYVCKGHFSKNDKIHRFLGQGCERNLGLHQPPTTSITPSLSTVRSSCSQAVMLCLWPPPGIHLPAAPIPPSIPCNSFPILTSQLITHFLLMTSCSSGLFSFTEINSAFYISLLCLSSP